RGRKWSLRLGVVLVLSVLGLWWRGCALPAAPAHARVAPDVSRVPKLRVCWVEFAHKNEWGWLGTPGFSRNWTWKTTASGVVVRHRGGAVLAAAGNSPNSAPELEELHFFPRLYLKMAAGGLKTTTRPTEALAKIGVDPAKLKWFIPSHAHLD